LKNKEKVSVLFVCLGNICRSPTADGVFRQMVQRAGLEDKILVDSAGTAGYHIGESPDQRSAEAAKLRGYDLSSLRGRQVAEQDFDTFDYILAMDHSNLTNLRQLAPHDFKGHLGLFLEFGNSRVREVPDPYYGGAKGFEQVLDLVEGASRQLLAQIQAELR